MTTLRVYILDDHDVVRDGLRLYLDSVPDLQLVGEASTARDGIDEIDWLQPDVALIDAVLPDGEGLDVIRRLTARNVRTRFIVFTTYEVEDVLLQATMVGASGYLLKDAPRHRLIETIRAAGAGRSTIDGEMLDRVRRRRDRSCLDRLQPDLTAQEQRIVEMITEGATNREIGTRLSVTEKTARNYVSSILSKLGFRNRTEVAVYATRLEAATDRRPSGHGWTGRGAQHAHRPDAASGARRAG